MIYIPFLYFFPEPKTKTIVCRDINNSDIISEVEEYCKKFKIGKPIEYRFNFNPYRKFESMTFTYTPNYSSPGIFIYVDLEK